MKQRRIKAAFIRGGTSKGVFFRAGDLPEAVQERDAVLLRALGSPDPYASQLDELGDDPVAALFTEELGAVIQVRHSDTDTVLEALHLAGLGHYSHVIGTMNDADQITVSWDSRIQLAESRIDLQRAWSETTWHMQSLRDNPACAQEEYDALLDKTDLREEDIGEYTGQVKQVRPVTLSTYQILIYRKRKGGVFPHFGLLNAHDWGLEPRIPGPVVVSDHGFPA